LFSFGIIQKMPNSAFSGQRIELRELTNAAHY
jgi:hypothetical protein